MLVCNFVRKIHIPHNIIYLYVYMSKSELQMNICIYIWFMSLNSILALWQGLWVVYVLCLDYRPRKICDVYMYKCIL